MDFKEIGEYNLLSLAYLGDAVWDLALRDYFFRQNLKVETFNKRVRLYVNAKSQSIIYTSIFDQLEDPYKVISKRGRNTKIKSFAKSCSPREYRNATAFEVLVATYHLRGEQQRIDDLLKLVIEGDLINEKK